MDIDKSAAFLAGSVLIMLGVITIVAGGVVINIILNKYWKPVRIFTADSWQTSSEPSMPQYATEEELAKNTETRRNPLGKNE